MPSVLITGCDYGIGRELANQYAAQQWRVHATCLLADSEADLRAIDGDVHFYRLDVTDPQALNSVADKLAGEDIDVLINNAATFAPDGPGLLELPEPDEFVRVMRVNAVAPVYVAEAFLEHVARSQYKVMAFLSTRSGSIGDNSSGGHYAYRCSKSALNMAVKGLSLDFASRGIVTVALHPGSVSTETRGANGIAVEDSVAGLRKVIEELTAQQSGSFRRYDGGTIEW